MKKYLPYILGILLGGAIVGIVVTGNNPKRKQFDDRVTLRKKDKIPYGTYVAFSELDYLFPKASIYSSQRDPGYWDSLSIYDENQAVIIITPAFFANELELKKLMTFAQHGNEVFISARYFSPDADSQFHCFSSAYDLNTFSDSQMEDSLELTLHRPPFADPLDFAYPGKKFSTYFSTYDSTSTDVLGHDDRGRANFLHIRAGKGDIYIHSEPLVFSNYFLLYKENIAYYEKVLSVISRNVGKVLWDEFYLNKRDMPRRKKNKSWTFVLFQYPAFKAGFLTAILTILIYVLLEMRRKQRYIPAIAKPRNETLDFVRTIGRLYYDKADHLNLCRKMAAYFLEHVRNRYKLPTANLNEDFIRNLQFKSGVSDVEIRTIVSSINSLESAPGVTNQQLTQFHKRLESFYNKA